MSDGVLQEGPQCIDHYEIIEGVEPVAYRLTLSSNLSRVHPAFHSEEIP